MLTAILGLALLQPLPERVQEWIDDPYREDAMTTRSSSIVRRRLREVMTGENADLIFVGDSRSNGFNGSADNTGLIHGANAVLLDESRWRGSAWPTLGGGSDIGLKLHGTQSGLTGISRDPQDAVTDGTANLSAWPFIEAVIDAPGTSGNKNVRGIRAEAYHAGRSWYDNTIGGSSELQAFAVMLKGADAMQIDVRTGRQEDGGGSVFDQTRLGDTTMDQAEDEIVLLGPIDIVQSATDTRDAVQIMVQAGSGSHATGAWAHLYMPFITRNDLSGLLTNFHAAGGDATDNHLAVSGEASPGAGTVGANHNTDAGLQGCLSAARGVYSHTTAILVYEFGANQQNDASDPWGTGMALELQQLMVRYHKLCLDAGYTEVHHLLLSPFCSDNGVDASKHDPAAAAWRDIAIAGTRLSLGGSDNPNSWPNVRGQDISHINMRQAARRYAIDQGTPLTDVDLDGVILQAGTLQGSEAVHFAPDGAEFLFGAIWFEIENAASPTRVSRGRRVDRGRKVA